MSEQFCIGVYDSGRGGRCVVSKCRKLYPKYNWIVLEDNDFFPYGLKTQVQLIERGERCITKLIDQGAKAVVVACHTSSLCALDVLQKRFDIPLIGMRQPTLEGVLKSGVTDLLWCATEASINAGVFIPSLKAYGYEGKIQPVVCTAWVSAIEEGEVDPSIISATVNEVLCPWRQKMKPKHGLLLGCTHFHVWAQRLSKLVGDSCVVLDPVEWVCAALGKHLHCLEVGVATKFQVLERV